MGDLEGALAEFDKAIRLNPKIAETYMARGTIYRLMGDLSRALADFNQTLSLNPPIRVHTASGAWSTFREANLTKPLQTSMKPSD